MNLVRKQAIQSPTLDNYVLLCECKSVSVTILSAVPEQQFHVCMFACDYHSCLRCHECINQHTVHTWQTYHRYINVVCCCFGSVSFQDGQEN